MLLDPSLVRSLEIHLCSAVHWSRGILQKRGVYLYCKEAKENEDENRTSSQLCRRARHLDCNSAACGGNGGELETR